MPILSPNTLEFISRAPEQTRRIGARLGALLTGSEVIALEGDLGAGKTVLAQGIGIGWGASSRLLSPTFVLIRSHRRHQDKTILYHVDLYRIDTSGEAWDLGLGEMFGASDTICVVEWPDRARDLFPEEHLWICLRWQEHHRRSLTFHAGGTHHQALLDAFRKEIIGR